MFSVAASRSQRLAVARPARPSIRPARRVALQVSYAKKSKEEEREDAYMEQMAYLERRRQRLISPRVPKSNKQRASSADDDEEDAPVVQQQVSKAKAVVEPSIKIEAEQPRKKQQGGNPLGFLSNLFGAK